MIWKSDRTGTRPTAPDVILVLVLAAASLAVGGLFSGKGGSPAGIEVVADSRVVLSAGLDEDRFYRVEGPLGFSVVEVHGGRVRMKESPCPHKVCLRMGWKEEAGESIVCLPNRVGVFLRGKRRDGIDAVSR